MWNNTPLLLILTPYIPHGHCYLWQSSLIWLHSLSDVLIAIAYYSIPLMLVYFVNQRQDVPFKDIFVLFSAFIIACGTTHLMEVVTLWQPFYWISGSLKAATALISVFTAAELWLVIPEALALPSTAQLAAMNRSLEQEISQRQSAEEALMQLNMTLEHRVAERTAALEAANQQQQALLVQAQQAQEATELAQQQSQIIEEQFRATFEQAAVGIAHVATDGTWLRVNKQLCSITGYSENELLQRTFQDITHPDDLEADLAYVEQLLAGTLSTYTMEKRYLRKDQSILWVKLTVSLVRQEKGEPKYFISVVEDIRDRKQAEQALQQSQSQLQVILDNAPSVVYLKEPEGQLQLINQEFQRIFERSEAEVIGKTDAELFPPEVAATLRENDRQVVASGQALVTEEIVQQADGKWHTYLSTKFPIADTQGRITQIGGIATDITERKQMEQALRDSQERMDCFVQSDLIGIVFARIDGRIQEANDEFLRIIGYSRQELEAGQVRWDTLTPPEYLPLDRTGIAEAQDRGSCTPYEKEYIRKDGRRVPVLVGYILLGVDRTDSIAFVLDITQRKQAEQALQAAKIELEERVLARTAELDTANSSLQVEVEERQQREQELERTAHQLATSNQALQDFAYVASHDLQEPLRKIQAFGDRLRTKYSDALGEQGQDYLRRMQNAAQRMQSLIQALLHYSRISTRGNPFVTTDLNVIVKGVLSDLETRIEQSAAQIQVEPLSTLEADPVQMRQLFQNLIGNALKFHQPDTSPQITISQTADSTQVVELRVQDNGIGFNPKYLDRIFTPFERLHSRSEYEGTGMGLAICRKIIERHGGQLTAVSPDEGGAIFIATLPYTQPQAYEQPVSESFRSNSNGGR